MRQREAKIPAWGKVRLTEAIERLVQLYESIGARDLVEIAILAVVIYGCFVYFY